MVDSVQILLSNYPEEIGQIAGELRRIARRAMPGAYEFLYYDAINYSLTDSPLSRICYIRPAPKRVTLGLPFGRQLDDPHRLLQGGGKMGRYVRVRTLEDAKSPLLEELIRSAWAHGAPSAARKRLQTKKVVSLEKKHVGLSRMRSVFGARTERSRRLHSRRR